MPRKNTNGVLRRRDGRAVKHWRANRMLFLGARVGFNIQVDEMTNHALEYLAGKENRSKGDVIRELVHAKIKTELLVRR